VKEREGRKMHFPICKLFFYVGQYNFGLQLTA